MTTEEQMYRVTRFIWYAFYVIEAFLGFRVVLKLLAANAGAGFTQFIYTVSDVFVAPFQYVFGTPAIGGSALELSTILAMIVYWFIAWGIIKLIVMNRDVSKVEAEESLEEQDRV